jgi:hypothetical protein
MTVTEACLILPWLNKTDIEDIFEALDKHGLMIAPQQLTDADVNRGCGRDLEDKPTPATKLFRNFWDNVSADYIKDIKTI